MILVLDNYDSFTYNLVHYLEQVTDVEIEVHRNDKISLNEVARFEKILLSPGPGVPSEAGILIDLIKTYSPEKNILGICLGQQAIAEAFGGTLVNSTEIFHGVATPIKVIQKDAIFNGVPSEFNAGRYHSWVVDEKIFPGELEILAVDGHSRIMALKHKKYNVRGLQFHPESILTEHGLALMQNWVDL